MSKDYSKLQSFIEAAVTNEAHPVYQVGWVRSPILQHYALNVMNFKFLTPKQWFESVSHDWVEKVEKVMALCEAGDQEEQAKADELQALKDEVAALKAQLSKAEASEQEPEQAEDEDEKKKDAEEQQPEPEAVPA